MAATPLICPACGAKNLDVRHYDAMMVLSPDLALFTVRCPHCKTKISTMRPIPEQLRNEVRYAAMEVGAGMGEARA